MTIGRHLSVVLFIMIASALIGVFFFKGKIENRCRITPSPVEGHWYINETIVTLCGANDCPDKYI